MIPHLPRAFPPIVTYRFISDETLLGYLIGALDDQENLLVQEALQKDRHLRIRLATLQSMTISMKDVREIFEPPGTMVSRVMSNVTMNDVESDRVVDDTSTSKLLSTNAKDLSLVSSSCDGKSSIKNVWLDAGISFSAAMIGFCLIAPAILQTRESARTTQCASGLFALGQQIRDFAFQNRHTTVPEIPVDGPLAFAGIYAIHLNDAGYLEEKQVLWCPSEMNYRLAVVGRGDRRLPSATELQTISAAKLRLWRHIAGGSYAYNLGMLVNNQHTMPNIESRSDVAILADAPIQTEKSTTLLTTHRGQASNILYRDGRVQLIRFDHGYEGSDHPYLNRLGLTEAGIDEDDSALGVSYLAPLGPSR